MSTTPPEQPQLPAQQPAYSPAPPAPPAYTPAAPSRPGTPGGNFRSGRGKTIGLIVAGVVAVGALGALGAVVLGGDESDDLSSASTGGGGQPDEEVSPSGDGGILNPTPLGSATPEPSTSGEPTPSTEPTEPTEPTEEPSTDLPTEGPAPTLDPTSDTDVVTIGTGVQVPVLPGWEVVGQGDTDVLLGDGDNSFVYAVTGTVDPSSDAASVISASMDNILPRQSYTQLKKTDISPLQAFGSVVSIAGMQYRATWTDQQASVPLQGLLICAVRMDGTAIIMTAEHAPPKEFEDSANSWAPLVNATLGLFGSS